ncbi:hypothetical protein LJR251_002746 [Rhizobium rhizogenes]|uniref:hypothetical protein n=1 Tax=Rhizobium rhizogenes TaxID=359 RepID=UPI003ED08528
MWYLPKTVGVKPELAVSLEAAKRQCGELDENSEFNDDIARISGAAQDHAERYCGQFFSPRRVTIECDGFADFARIGAAPVRAITSIVYVDTLGASQLLPDSAYVARLDGMESSIALKAQHWPATHSGSRVEVTADIGYETAPPSVIHAMLLWIGAAFINRENSAVDGITAFDDLLVNHRRNG